MFLCFNHLSPAPFTGQQAKSVKLTGEDFGSSTDNLPTPSLHHDGDWIGTSGFRIYSVWGARCFGLHPQFTGSSACSSRMGVENRAYGPLLDKLGPNIGRCLFVG